MPHRPIDPASWDKLRRPDRVCVAICAFWQGDRPDGFNVRIENLDANGSTITDLDVILEEIDACTLRWQSLATRPDPNDFFQFIRGVATSKTQNQQDVFHAIAMISYLEQIGALVSDEFNGVMFIYQQGANTLQIEQRSPSGAKET